MNELYTTLLTAIIRYYTHLEQFGKISNDKFNNLSVLLFIKQIVTGPMGHYIEEADYKVINKVLYYLVGKSCLISYKAFKLQPSFLDPIYTTFYVKMSEEYLTRYAEDDSVRFQLL